MSRINKENLFSPYCGDAPFIHVICARDDFKRVYNIIRRLNQDGYNIWYNEDNFSADSNIAEKSMKNISKDNCKAVLLFYSSACELSLAIQNEINSAVNNNKYFCCTVLDKNTELPSLFDRYTNKQVAEDPNRLSSFLPRECIKGATTSDDTPEEQTNFLTDTDATGIHIKRFYGNDSYIEIPVQIGGRPVKSIDNFAFSAKYPIRVSIPSTVTSIAISAFSFNNSNVTIVCPENSAAHRFARAEKVAFELSGFDSAAEILQQENIAVSNEKPLELPANLELQKDYEEPYIYVSFARQDTETVRPILERLCSMGYRIYVSDRTKQLIPQKIAASAVFLIFISEKTYYDEYVVNAELPCLGNYSGLYYSACIDTHLTIPEGFRTQRMGKKTINRTDYRDFDRFFTALCEPLAFCRNEGEFSCSDFDYTSSKHGAIITKYNGYSTRPEIPAFYSNQPVVEIGEFAFAGCDFLEQVIVPEGVTAIGGFAFSGCKSLKTVSLPNSLDSLGGFAFSGCTSLESIVLPDGISSTGTNLFDGCLALTDISMPAELREMSWYFFNNCSALRTVSIAEGTQTVGDFAFAGCTMLGRVEIPQSVTSIGKHAFKGCSNAIIVASKKSYAKKFAVKRGVDFKASEAKGKKGGIIAAVAAVIVAAAVGAAQYFNVIDIPSLFKNLF